MSLRFENLFALWGLLGVAVFIGYSLYQRRQSPTGFLRRRLLLLTLAFSLCIFGLARPQWGRQVARNQGFRANLFVAIDISRSMLAQDTSPSRLEFSVAFTSKILQNLKGVRVAIFPFALDGYLLMPLSTDIAAAQDLLSSVSPSMTTNQGTDFNASLETLLRQIKKMEQSSQDQNGEWAPTQVLILSDGEAHTPLSEDTLSHYHTSRIPLFTVAVGTAQGAPIPTENRLGLGKEALRDANGATVITKMVPDQLMRLAKGTGGDFFAARFEETPRVTERLTQSMQMGKLTTSFKIDKEFYPTLFILALLLISVEVFLGRWEYALRATLAVLFLCGVGGAAEAADPSREPQSQSFDAYHQGLNLLSEGALPQAAESFQESAGAAKDRELKKRALYNLGNTLYRMQDPSQAIQVYQQAHDIQTGNQKFDADANRRISDNIVLASRLEEQMKKQEKKQDPQDGEGEGKPDPNTEDPNGPKKDYQAESFSDAQRQKILDLVSAEEQQTMQRIMDQKKKPSSPNGKAW